MNRFGLYKNNFAAIKQQDGFSIRRSCVIVVSLSLQTHTALFPQYSTDDSSNASATSYLKGSPQCLMS